jgi:hypothetical protein
MLLHEGYLNRDHLRGVIIEVLTIKKPGLAFGIFHEATHRFYLSYGIW